jgi:hypothetical protein
VDRYIKLGELSEGIIGSFSSVPFAGWMTNRSLR